ncbi:hypothetical protein Zmor_022076, partial [Zophobas morio]
LSKKNDETIETFIVPQTTTIALERLAENEAALKKAIENAVNLDSVTQVMDEIEVKPSKNSSSDDLNQLKEDFNVVVTSEAALPEKPKEQPKNEEQIIDMDSVRAELVGNSEEFMQTKTIEVIQKVEEQVEMDKKRAEVDISEEAMNKSFEQKIQNNFLSAFSNQESSAPTPVATQPKPKQTVPHTETQIIYDNLSNGMSEIKTTDKVKIETEPESIQVDEKEMNRIESLLNIDDFDLGIAPVKLLRPQNETSVLIKDNSNNNQKKASVNDESTKALTKQIASQDELIQNLSQKVEELAKRKPLNSSISLKQNIISQMTELTFETNVTAALNLQSILQEPFNSRGISLTLGCFVALAAGKTVAKNGIDSDGILFNYVKDLKILSAKI